MRVDESKLFNSRKSPMMLPLVQQIHAAVAVNPYLVGDGFCVEASDDKLTLRGTVSTFYKKQMAQEAVREIVGDVPVENAIEVTWN